MRSVFNSFKRDWIGYLFLLVVLTCAGMVLADVRMWQMLWLYATTLAGLAWDRPREFLFMLVTFGLMFNVLDALSRWGVRSLIRCFFPSTFRRWYRE